MINPLELYDFKIMYALRIKYILVALWHILPHQLCAQSAEVTAMLDVSVLNDLLNYNDGSIAVYEGNDKRITELLTVLQDILCLDERYVEILADCSVQNAGKAMHDSRAMTYFLEKKLDSKGFSAIIEEVSTIDRDSLQLRQIAFIHFPENEESIEIRSYINPRSQGNELLLWKTDIFSSQYFTKSRKSVPPHFDLSVLTAAGVATIQIEGEWIGEMLCRLFTFSGKEVWQSAIPRNGNITSIALPRLDSGLYILLVNDFGQQKSLKLYIAP